MKQSCMMKLRPVGIAVTVAIMLISTSCNGNDDDSASDDGRATTTTTISDDATATSAPDADATVTTGGAPSTTSGATPTTQSGAGAGGDDADPEADGVIEVTITGGSVEGGVQRRTVKQGSQVTLRFTSDAADEVHVHTYDLRQDLTAGQSADITFLAKIPGVIEVELENRKRKVLELEVRP